MDKQSELKSQPSPMKRHERPWMKQTDMFTVYNELCMEIERAIHKHGNGELHREFASAHELASILREEQDGFWDSVKVDDPDPAELIQIAAVAVSGVLWLAKQARVECEREAETTDPSKELSHGTSARHEAIDNG